MADRCRKEITKVHVTVNGETVAVTASFGVADANNLPSLEALMKRADEALYRAKQAGRNLVRSCGEDAAISADIGSASGDTTMNSENIAGREVSFAGGGHDK